MSVGPLVSIITPVLNRAESLGTCLASVANQSRQSIEHIVIDGGSTDGTLDLLRGFRAPYRFHWVSETDRGMYDAINKGISLARGDVLAYLNSDDLYLPWSVDVAVRALRPGIDLIYGDLGVVQAEGNGSPASFHMQFYRDFDLRHYSFIEAIGQPTVFWRRSLTERIGLFDIGYRLIGDCEYWLRAAIAGAKLRHVPELLAFQVEHDSTLRATQPVSLSKEFDRLRHNMTALIDPPSSLRWERFKKSVSWRARQLEFFHAMRTSSPRKWRQFVMALRAHGMEVGLRDLRAIAPARWRGDSSLFGDALRVYEILGGSE